MLPNHTLLWIQGGMVSVTLSYSVMDTGGNGKCYLIIDSVMDTGGNGKCYLIILCYGYRGKW